METSLQKPACIALVNAFQTEGHLAACHLVAHGRTATACRCLIWLQSQNHPVHTISASVPKLSATPTTLHNLKHLPWYFPAVTLICLLCIKDLCRPAKQSISTSLEAICTLKHQSREHNIFLFLKIWILHPLRQPLLQRAGRNELSSKAQIYPNNTAQARLHFKNK